MGVAKAAPKRRVSGDLALNPRNPRKITDAKLVQLSHSMDEFGDISGIVFNRRSGNLTGGNQRSKELDKTSRVVIAKRYPKVTKKGTVAVGYILHRGERFSFREVDWDDNRERLAMIAANKNAGEWDTDELSAQLRNLGSFDLDVDLSLTMFDDAELSKMILRAKKTTKTEKDRAPSKLVHQCPECGHEFQ